MVEAFSPYRAHEALGIWVLPGGARGRENLLDADALDATSELLAIDSVAVADHVPGGGVLVSSGKASTTCWAVQAALGNSEMLKWTTRRRSWSKTKNTSSTRKVAVGTVKKSIEAS